MRMVVFAARVALSLAALSLAVAAQAQDAELRPGEPAPQQAAPDAPPTPAPAPAAAEAAEAAEAEAEDDYVIRSRADLQRYIDAFNARDYATQIRFYAPDVAFNVGDLQIRSPQDIAAFYDDFHDYVDEHVEIARYAKTGDTVAIVVPTRFAARETYDKNGLLFEAGSVRDSVSLVFYDLKDGKIWRVRMARYAGPASDFE
jgi:predicted lipid-binding transport protein (Tim44 family)